jgi:hypothetical protein
MIEQSNQYTIYGRRASNEPPVVETYANETVQGSVKFPGSACVFTAAVQQVHLYTGIKKYEAITPDIYASSTGILSYTGMQSTVDFVFDPSEVRAPTGAIRGEQYGIQFRGTETGCPNHKYIADIVVKIIDQTR